MNTIAVSDPETYVAADKYVLRLVNVLPAAEAELSAANVGARPTQLRFLKQVEEVPLATFRPAESLQVNSR
jgi:hypothetical protein